ncbi:lasso peptide biosynthesis PqqD family chaperone [Halobacillus sp. K22]|uniref:lasso peptide biosynthesis PqqD family chaperone n=1 Tax=Halobacillus sp. K22 TaxID=3457431 RepID=UPI003FCE0C57
MSQSVALMKVVQQKEGQIVSDMDGERVMLSIENGKYYNLGELGGEIWDRIEEPKAVRDLIEDLLETYEVERGMCEEQVQSFLNHLKEENLIEVKAKASE